MPSANGPEQPTRERSRALLNPTTIVEIGTATGMSALAMKIGLPDDGRIVTFDITAWREYHDGAQERNFLRGFDQIGLDCKPIVMFDDIRLWGMLAFWREITRPKLDLTSFGHWSGTGLVDYA